MLSRENLNFEHNTSDSALDNVGSVEAVDAVGAKYAALFTDRATSVDPEPNITLAPSSIPSVG